ncbi:uncharacterized protein LOC127736408 [Mytilus californianus]|uniref:uncharacterized protein LOC127736408 n=1 Tax=Mytilus californianus TaxID=6549 RepID=UPI002246F142|nr:uncharacterized protein LOC127736408 [Mytilus californianus]
MVLVPVEEYKTLDTKKPSSEPLYLHFDFDADLLETDDKIEEQLRQISEVIIKHSNGSGTNSNITATLLPISPEIIPTTTEAFAQAQTPAINNLPVSITFRQELDISFSKNNYRCIHECIKIGKKIVFTDHSYKKRVIICDVDGANVQLFPLSYAPCYITEVDTNTVAVSCSYNKIILIVNLTTGSITSTIKTSDFCWGISYDGNNLYALVGKLLKVINMTGNVIHTILLPSVRTCGIAIHKNRLICIDKAAIYCCSLDGKLMWKFQNDKYRNLYHVTIDDDDNIYVTDRDTSTVIVVSADGRHNREILTQSDGLYRPTGIHFDKNENVMLVCNENNRKAFLFDVI